MDVSPVGLAIVALLIVVSRAFGQPLVVATIASFAFGATAVVSLDALGGASPLISVVPNLALVALMVLRRGTVHRLQTAMMQDTTHCAVALLTVYAAASAVLFPRLFENVTTAFVASRALGVTEVPLAPVSGNLSQTAYFVLGTLSFGIYSVFYSQPGSTEVVARGCFFWSALTAAFGLIDRLGKLVSGTDVLEPIRTASYAMLTHADLSLAGFPRIAGAFSEASGFGGAALAGFAFNFAYWRRTRSRGALTLAVVLAGLVLLSTSTTAYVGFAVLAGVQAFALARNAISGRLTRPDLMVGAALAVCCVVVLAAVVARPDLLDPIMDLLSSTLIDKGQSASGLERAYWNSRSLESVLETGGFGIGLGSSRSSNWMIAVLSQLGVAGAVLMAVVVAPLFGALPHLIAPDPQIRRIVGLHDGARLAALAMLLTATVSGGTADPGSLFFIFFATVLGCRTQLRVAMWNDGAVTRYARAVADRGERISPQVKFVGGARPATNSSC